jgi:hypothetical protein
VREHLICDGFQEGYRTWSLHGEASSSFENHGTCDVPDFIEQPSEDDDISELIRDLACGLDDRGDVEDDRSFEPSNEDVVAIHKLNADNRQELYPGSSNYSKLCFLVWLLHLKLLGGWADRSFDLLVDLLVDAMSKGSALPRNFHEAKKLVKSIGVGYTNIHASENDCILLWKEHENYDSCLKCKVSLWKSNKKSLDAKCEYKVPRKILCYFPIKRRPQRLFVIGGHQMHIFTGNIPKFHSRYRR